MRDQMISIQPLSTENLRGGIFCPHGDADGGSMYDQLEAWLSGEMLRGHVAYSGANDVCGFILYYPVEAAPIEILGEGFYIIQCLYVKPEYGEMGIGKALVEAAMQDAGGHGASGVAVTTYSSRIRAGFEYMPTAFFEKLGFMPVDERGTATLLFARLREGTVNPGFAPARFNPQPIDGKLRVDVLDCSRCYVGVKTSKLIDKIAESLGDKVEVRHHNQNSRGAVLDKGMSNGVFIDGRLTFFEAPISEDDMMRALEVALEAYETRTDRIPEA